jgi:hypothetical protein
MLLGEPQRVWPLLGQTQDPQLRTCLTHTLTPAGVDPGPLLERLRTETEPILRIALLLSLGEYAHSPLLTSAQRGELVPGLLKTFEVDPHPGLHSASEWLLRQLGHADEIAPVEQRLKKQGLQPGRDWYVTSQGQTMAIIRGPVEFLMGSPAGKEVGRDGGEPLHQEIIPRSFAMGSKEVTLNQFRGFWKDYLAGSHGGAEREIPAELIEFRSALNYCNWLSRAEGIPEDQLCFQEGSDGKLRPRADCLTRSGYRLPTEAEWEYCCRANTTTRRHDGFGKDFIGAIAWYQDNSDGRVHAVGQLKPNNLGLFDMYGNAVEWCVDKFDVRPSGDLDPDWTQSFRVNRGGSFSCTAIDLRSARRRGALAESPLMGYGFRIARTLPQGTTPP